MENLVWRKGKYYEKVSLQPFDGLVEGFERGIIENGRKTRTWVSFYPEGQLREKVSYKLGTRDRLAEKYSENGKLTS